jgi:AraC-like DNA-binding protein
MEIRVASTFNLDDTPPGKRFSYFRDVVESFYIPIGLACEKPERFDAWVKGTELGEVSVGTCFLAEQRVSRTTAHIARSEDDRVKLILPMSGAMSARQDGNNTLVRPGGFYMTDPTRPYEECIVEDLTFVYLLLPRNELAARIGQIEKVTATGFDRTQPYARLASDFAHSLSSVWNSIEGPAAVQAGRVAADLFTMALWERMGHVRTHSTSHRSALFHRARTFIDEHLADGDLSLGKVAAAIGVSTRYLSGLLAQGGFSYRRYVLEQWLTQCARDLVDPRLAQRAITAIAFSWGFFDSAHFSRAFKSVCEVSPREYRSSRK